MSRLERWRVKVPSESGAVSGKDRILSASIIYARNFSKSNTPWKLLCSHSGILRLQDEDSPAAPQWMQPGFFFASREVTISNCILLCPVFCFSSIGLYGYPVLLSTLFARCACDIHKARKIPRKSWPYCNFQRNECRSFLLPVEKRCRIRP